MCREDVEEMADRSGKKGKPTTNTNNNNVTAGEGSSTDQENNLPPQP